MTPLRKFTKLLHKYYFSAKKNKKSCSLTNPLSPEKIHARLATSSDSHTKTNQTVHANKQRDHANQWAQFLYLFHGTSEKVFSLYGMFFSMNTAAKIYNKLLCSAHFRQRHVFS